jgi:hypothetical protein
MKTPIVITTLEEDFKKIGLIKAAPIAESVEADEADETELDEGKRRTMSQRRQRRRKAGKKTMGKMPVELASAGELAKRRRSYAKNRVKIQRQADRRSRSSRGKKLAALRIATAEAFDAAEALKSFANAAIIAERLQTIFTEWVKTDLCESREDETGFLKLAGALATIAEEFAEIATALNESAEELDEEAVTEIFNEGLETVLDAVDLYEKNCGGKGEEEEEEEEMDDSEEEEEESDDEGND